MILTGPEIRRIVEYSARSRADGYEPPMPRISITPFDPKWVGPNSIDLHLNGTLLVYDTAGGSRALDCHADNPTRELVIPPEGLVLSPGVLYLGCTVERTSCEGLVPWIDGRSSVGRLGICVHATAGRGDDGFGSDVPGGCSWTLEITVVHPVRVYAGMRICQLTLMTLVGDRQPYRGRYRVQDAPTPSRFWQDAADLQRKDG